MLMIDICELEYGQPHVSRGCFKSRFLLLQEVRMKTLPGLPRTEYQGHRRNISAKEINYGLGAGS